MITRYVLVSIGSMVITLWGIAHLLPTKSVVSGFGTISGDNRKIITMEWIAEGLTLCFIGLLVLLVTLYAGPQNLVSVIVYRATAWMLVVMAGLTFMTGAKTSITPINICPLVKSIVAILFFLGSAL
jgi:phosphoglycerol transferase MdoB-like AlkP superfamily enzyme